MAKIKKTATGGKHLAGLVWRLAEPIAEKQGLEIVDIEYVKEAGEWYLRIFIDREQAPVDHNCCQIFSEALAELLDEADPIAESYYLEVSSPGIERPLKKDSDFIRFSGNKVKLLLYAPLDGKKEYIGDLTGLIDGNIVLSIEGKDFKIPKESVAKAMLSVFS